MTRVDEIAADIFRISLYVPELDLQFNQFLIRDDEPLLFETGMKQIFPLVRDAVSKVMDPASLRYVSFSHYEPDECGSLNEWLAIAPRAETLCSIVGAMVFVNDAAARPARSLAHDEQIQTGKHTLRFKSTPHLPHGWDAGVLFEETDRLLLCSDLMHQLGDVEPVNSGDVVGRYRQAFETYQHSPVLMDYVPYTENTKRQLANLAALQPRILAAMHGSTFVGDGAAALVASGEVIRQVTGVSATI